MRVLGITLGDVTGIGPEVTFKALQGSWPADVAFVLVGDEQITHTQAKACGFGIPLRAWPGRSSATPGIWRWPISDWRCPEMPKSGDASAARAAVDWLKLGTQLAFRGEFDGVVTAPVNKEAILKAGIPFVGQTEVVTEIAGSPPTAMMLLGTDSQGRWLRVLLATTHLPLRSVPDALTPEGLRQTFRLADLACRQLGLSQRRIGVCGLNPHAGEGGYMGREEVDWIAATVEEARREGLEVSGPHAADTLFYRALHGQFEVVVAMYHDQGLAPLKLVAFDTGVNWTVGLPFIRTSPDHGTAYEIAGKNVADASSMKSAIQLALQWVENRSL